VSTHTPGPWQWQDAYSFREHKEHQEQGLDADCENIREGRIRLMAGDFVVLDEWGAYEDGGVSVQMADARLIEAAPDLLAALGDLLSVIETDDLLPESVSYMKQARAAIKKAEGR
jgi:hypothetical protein